MIDLNGLRKRRVQVTSSALISARVTPETKRQVEQLCAERGITVSSLVGGLLAELLAELGELKSEV